MEEQKQFHIQEKDITATQNGLWLRVKNKINWLHGLFLNTVPISMRDSH